MYLKNSSQKHPLCKKCPYSEFFWSVFSPNAGNTEQKSSKCGHFSDSDLDVIFDKRLIFEEHRFRRIFSKENKNIGLLQNLLIRPCPDQGDISYDQTFSFSFQQKPESSYSDQWYLQRKAFTRIKIPSILLLVQ